MTDQNGNKSTINGEQTDFPEAFLFLYDAATATMTEFIDPLCDIAQISNSGWVRGFFLPDFTLLNTSCLPIAPDMFFMTILSSILAIVEMRLEYNEESSVL